MVPLDVRTSINEASVDMDGKQSMFLIRHGDRWDYENPDWLKTTTRPGDPPLSRLGHLQARETGVFLDSILAEEGISAQNMTWLSSPFLRCLQTSNEALGAFSRVEGISKLTILPEYSVFEWDGHGGRWHESLPPLEERFHYFPRLAVAHESLFTPILPEPRAEFHKRCDKVIQSIHKRYPYSPRSALIIVTHAAASVGLARAASGLLLDAITPAAPCSIFRLTRTSDTPVWDLDPHDAPESMNGYTDHLSNIGGKTVPWNHFGDKSVGRGYTGPLNSRFAPAGLREEL